MKNNVTYQTIPNKIKQIYFNLLKDGYYLRPCIYEDGTVYEIVKDLNPVNCSAYRKIFGTVNRTTANFLKHYFGFKTGKKTLYFGFKEVVVKDWEIIR